MRLALSLLRLFSLTLAGCAGALGQSISGFTPEFGAPGDPVTIMGNGFAPSNSLPTSLAVKVNNTIATTDPNAVVSDTMIQIQVPAGATTGPIRVQINNGTLVSSAENFTVITAGPYVTGFSPWAGNSGLSVTIGGVHFTNPVTVKFNGVNASSATATTFEQISATTPNGVTTGPITVTTAAGTYTTATNFFVPPAVTGFSPANGRSGTNVVVTGNNFSNATTVRFNGTNGTFTLLASPNVLSNGAIQVTVPAGATSGPMRVVAPAGSADSSSAFVVQPTIFGFSPGFGPVGASVTVTGANFNVTSLAVRFNGVLAAAPTGVTFGQLTVTVPSATTGPITVTTADGTATSAQLFYLPASITSFTPTNSAPGTRVTITGNNFSNATSVTFNGAAAVSPTVTNNTTIGATVPAGVTTGPIGVTTPAGTATSAGLFYAAPIITSFTPTHGLPGTNVTILGTNFLGATAVLFNGLNAQTFSVPGNGTIQATVPNGATTGRITVIAPAGTNTSAGTFSLDYTSDVTVTVTDAPDPVFVTSNLTYTIVIANNGPFPAPNVTLLNTLAASVILKSAGATEGTLTTNANPVLWNLASLGVSQSATVTLVVAPQSTGLITNLATVTSDYTDPASTNNTSSITTAVYPLAILSIERTAPDRVRVAWPLPLSNFMLEFKAVLATTNTWSNVMTVPQMSTTENFVTETNAGVSKFYRLRY